MRGCPVDEIAEKLGCHRWLVCRGVERSGCDRGYDAEIAQRVCDERAERPKLVSESEIAERVREVIKKGWSPQAIAADLRQYRKSRHRRVCAETIYGLAMITPVEAALPEGLLAEAAQRVPQMQNPRPRQHITGYSRTDA